MNAKVCTIQPNFSSFGERLLQNFLFKESNSDGTSKPGLVDIPNIEAFLRIIEVVGSTVDEETSKAVLTAIRNSLYKAQVPYKVMIHIPSQDKRVVAIFRATEKAVAAKIESLLSVSKTYDETQVQPYAVTTIATVHPTPASESGVFKTPHPVLRTNRKSDPPRMGLFVPPVRPPTTLPRDTNKGTFAASKSSTDIHNYEDME